MLTLDSIPAVVNGVVARTADEETVIVNPTSGKINVLNSVGAFVWQQIDGKKSVRDIVEMLTATFDVSAEDAARDVLDFLNALAVRGMIDVQTS